MTTMMRKKPSYKRGDVILSRFPDSNLHTAKLRPGLIVQADNLQTNLPQLIVAMITSRMFRANHPSCYHFSFHTGRATLWINHGFGGDD